MMLDEQPLTEQEVELIEKLANAIVQRRLTAPAIFFLEISKPLNFLGSQTMVFFEPIIQSLFAFKHYDTYRALLERRDSIERLLIAIEKYDAELKMKEKEARRQRKEQKRAGRARKN